MELPQQFDNINNHVIDDLKQTLRKGSCVSLAAASFSIYAFEALQQELEQIDEFRFIFTQPTFNKVQSKKQKREFYIPKLDRERTLYGSDFEIKLRNNLTQRAIARECARWIRQKARFKTNITQKPMPGFLSVANENGLYTYIPFNEFTTTELGCERGDSIFQLIQRMPSPVSDAYLKNFLRYYGVPRVDGILADLGVSFHHFDAVERGFTFRADAPLDMRMNRNAAFTAQELLNTYGEEQLAQVLYLYGELRQSRRLAAAIIKARPLSTTGELVAAVKPLLKPSQEKKELSMVFQALRIEVNGELDALRKLLNQSIEVLNPGGRLAIITYHSLEDRLVKNFMRTGNVEGRQEKDFFGRVNTPWRVLTGKVITPSEEEVQRNPRSRSAKLRIAELVDQSSTTATNSKH